MSYVDVVYDGAVGGMVVMLIVAVPIALVGATKIRRITTSNTQHPAPGSGWGSPKSVAMLP